MPASELRNEVLRQLNVLEWWQSQGVRLAKGQQGKASVKVHCPIHIWGSLGKRLSERLVKGARILAHGRIRSKVWRSGEAPSVWIEADEVSVLDAQGSKPEHDQAEELGEGVAA